MRSTGAWRIGGAALLTALLLAGGCSHTLEGPAPQVAGLDPALVCTEQLTTTVTLTGAGLSPLAIDALTKDPKLALPSITLRRTADLDGAAVGDAPVTIPDDPADPAHSRVRWLSQTSMTFEVYPELGLQPGTYEITVRNGNGRSFTAAAVLGAVPPPVLESVEPDLVCVAQGARSLTLTGRYFLRVGDTLPGVQIDGRDYTADGVSGCTAAPGPQAGAQLCTQATVTVPEDDLAPGAHDVVLHNPAPAGCASTEAVTIAIVPPPALTSVEPDLICTSKGDVVLTLTGTGFVRVGADLPTVTIGTTDLTPDTMSGCAPIAGTLTGAESCTGMTVTVATGGFAPGSYPVTVTNPPPAGCTSTEPVTIAVVGPPSLQGVVPDLVCAANENVLTLTGTGFITMGAVLPTITIGSQSFPADSASGCTDIAGTLTGAQACTTLTVTVPADALAPGAYGVTVTNPPPADCSSIEAVTIAVVGRPEITALAPNPVCNSQGASTIDITGSGFLVVGGTNPAVAIDGVPATVTATSGCTPVAGTTLAAQTCTSLTISVPAGSLTLGAHQVTITNPPPADCGAAAASTLTVVPPPDVTGITPAVVCTGGGDFVVNGTGFAPGSTVSIGGIPATVTNVTPNAISVTAPPGLAPGTHDVTVVTGGCSDTLVAALTVTPGPAVYFVDPPVVYNGVNLQATIWVSGIAAAPASVWIRPSSGGVTTTLAHTWDPLHPHRVQAVVPAGLAAGDYDVTVDDGTCTATLPRGLHVTATLTVAIESITPPFGWRLADTAVTIRAVDPAPPGMVQFQATPRVYLNPDVTGPGTLASVLKAVTFVDATRLTAIVPQGLPAGVYDLIVVNPDGSVGLLDQAFTVTPDAAPPPEITAVTPASVIDQPGQSIQAIGQNFRSPGLTATCKDDAGNVYVVPGTGVTSTTTTASATFDMSVLGSGICVLRVTNSDGTYADYSAVAVTNPAQNLPATVADYSMVVARRALGATAGRATSQARLLYAIGGDDGTDVGLLASVEAAPVDLYGALNPWFLLPLDLPAGRSFAGAVTIGRFIYLVGGRVAAGPTTSVLRAEILDPGAAPEITDLNMEFAETGGLDAGLWYYRVAAVMDPADPSNPGGETLASDPLAVIVPPVPNKVEITIYWTAVPGAVSYRIYRSPTPDQLVGAARLIATVPAAQTSYLDQGATAGTEAPLPLGALGVWHEKGPLQTAREGAAVTFARDPGNPAGGFILYAAGGRSGPATALASYEYATITVAGDGSQTVGAFTAGGALLGTARWQAGGVAMDHDHASIVPAGDTWIYVLGGWNAGNTTLVSDVTAAKVTAGGALTPVHEVDNMTPGQAGYGFAGANNFLFAFGGGGGGPSSTTSSAKLCASGEPGCAGGAPEPPDLKNWNALGFNLQEARYLCGSGLESAFIFLAGGQTNTAPATNSVERTHW
ncbi:MAG: IPT/TIG domain-containing protein [Deltaproteobacteria bacterium]|nr:IPT/TIG domain-containing protein [Deltaproteobacteria bacterium]